MNLLGIDLGTTSVKAAVYAPDGTRIAAATRRHTTHRPAPGHAEQHPSDWWAGVTGVVAELGATGALRDLAAVGLCSQVNTHLVADAAGAPLHPAITWQDGRCAAAAATLNDRLSPQDRARVRGGLGTVDASNPAARAAWFAAHRPEVWARTERLLAPKDWLVQRLTGTAVADPLSSVGLVGPDGTYPDGLDLLVPGLSGLLPPLADPASVAGETTGAAGLPAGVPVAVGTMDAWSALLGGGITAPGDAIDVAGTSEVLAMAAEPGGGAPGVVAFPVWRGLHVHAGPTQAGGDALTWAAAALDAPVPDLLDLAATAAPGCGDVLFLPQLAGERAPLWDPELRGHWLGATLGTGRAELARAVLEGVAHAARHVLGPLETAAGRPAAALTVCGGGAHSDLWCQVKADVLDRPLRRTVERDAGVLGAALLAGLAVGAGSSVGELAARMVRVEREFVPDPRVRDRLDDAHGRYLAAQQALAPLFRAGRHR
ncbi:xylulokinase [Pseudonocardia parietis]|uniref:Xylulokinase n=1 Tax=Pseudonocardia parietis TaxID=570936 RepID=A0ABS4VRY7_9PSEU|nr:FGGY family carbohydrate kinase [Pseudonocardia parietis]MBP2366690.1 xylulokinase [Pseudonocardia parietis]